MRLSEAIRLGSMLRPQIRNEYSTRRGSCAVGAACDALGIGELGIAAAEMEWVKAFDVDASGRIHHRLCPVCGDGRPNTVNAITHLNDDHKWTREQIADWVQTIEPAQVGSEAARAVTSDVLQAVHADVESVGVK